jgi:hypothetical protein
MQLANLAAGEDKTLGRFSIKILDEMKREVLEKMHYMGAKVPEDADGFFVVEDSEEEELIAFKPSVMSRLRTTGFTELIDF